MEWRRFCVGISLIAVIIAVALLSTKGLNFGIDFKGGSLFEIQTKSGVVDIPDLRSRVGGLGLGEVQIQGLDEPTDALIRVEEQEGGETAQQEAAGKVQDALGEACPGLSAQQVRRRFRFAMGVVMQEVRTHDYNLAVDAGEALIGDLLEFVAGGFCYEDHRE